MFLKDKIQDNSSDFNDEIIIAPKARAARKPFEDVDKCVSA